MNDSFAPNTPFLDAYKRPHSYLSSSSGSSEISNFSNNKYQKINQNISPVSALTNMTTRQPGVLDSGMFSKSLYNNQMNSLHQQQQARLDPVIQNQHLAHPDHISLNLPHLQTSHTNTDKGEQMEYMLDNESHAKADRGELVPPILFVDVDKSLCENNSRLLAEISAHVNVDQIKFTKMDQTGKNLLIFAKSSAARDKILSCQGLFPTSRRVDFSSIDRRPAVILKGLTYQEAKRFEKEILECGVIQNGLVELKRSANSSNPNAVLKVKLICKDEGTKENLLRNHIYLECKKFYIERDMRQPTQCRKCHVIGHVAETCKSEVKCGRCNQRGHEGVCATGPSCANCNQGHSSFYKGCVAYKNSVNNLIEKQNGKNSASFTRIESAGMNYANAFKSNSSIESMFNKLLEKQQEQLESTARIENKLDKKIDQLEALINTRVDEIYKHIEDNIYSCEDTDDLIKESVVNLNRKINNEILQGQLEVANIIFDVMLELGGNNNYECLKNSWSNSYSKRISRKVLPTAEQSGAGNGLSSESQSNNLQNV